MTKTVSVVKDEGTIKQPASNVQTAETRAAAAPPTAAAKPAPRKLAMNPFEANIQAVNEQKQVALQKAQAKAPIAKQTSTVQEEGKLGMPGH